MEQSSSDSGANVQANPESAHYCSFMKTVLADVSHTHTLLPAPDHTEEKPPKSKLSRRLKHNDTQISERLAKFCVWHDINFKPETVTSGIHCYFLSVGPSINFTDERKSQVLFQGEAYTFEGFILVSNQDLQQVPPLCFQQHGYNYSLTLEPVEEEVMAFTKQEALLFEEYLFNVLLQLFNFTYVLKSLNASIVFIPKFSKEGMQVLALRSVLQWLMEMRIPLQHYLETQLKDKIESDIGKITDGWIITNPDLCPSSIRIDRIEWLRQRSSKGVPSIIHFSSVFNEDTKTGPGVGEYFRASSKELMISINVENFLLTGLHEDIVQRALLLPLLLHHILYHKSLLTLEKKLNYSFHDRQLLERALTQPPFSHFSTVLAEQMKVTESNCGLRRSLIRAGKSEIHCEGRLRQNEQLEFLGDAVLEYLCSLHLYQMFPDAKLGKLVAYRTLLIKNRHLATLAEKLEMHKYILAREPMQSISEKQKQLLDQGPTSEPATEEEPTTLPLDTDAHVYANHLEAIVGAVFLDGGLSAAQQVIAQLLFPEEELQKVWLEYPPHPLQADHPTGDRHMIPYSPILQKLGHLEQSTGVEFRHIRLLAKAFTHSSMQYSHLVGGNYEKLEHLGDAILQFLVSDYLYHKFPKFHEGQLSLLRITLVQNKQLAQLCKELGFDQYIRCELGTEVGIKILADVVESYLAALLLDKGLDYCQKFLKVCIFPKLTDVMKILDNVDDSKTQLQRAIARICHDLRLEHEQPIYRQLGSSKMPPFKVGVYFKGRRLAAAMGTSLKDARQKAALQALQNGSLERMFR